MRPTGSRETGAVNAAGFVEEPTFLEGALAGALVTVKLALATLTVQRKSAWLVCFFPGPRLSVWRQWCGEERGGQRFEIGNRFLGCDSEWASPLGAWFRSAMRLLVRLPSGRDILEEVEMRRDCRCRSRQCAILGIYVKSRRL